jgi:hypothetical protein
LTCPRRRAVVYFCIRRVNNLVREQTGLVGSQCGRGGGPCSGSIMSFSLALRLYRPPKMPAASEAAGLPSSNTCA